MLIYLDSSLKHKQLVENLYLRPDVSHKTISKPSSFPFFTACESTACNTVGRKFSIKANEKYI